VEIKMKNILVTTLGGSWQILPELLGFTNPDLVDLFKHHPEKHSITRARKKEQIVPADEAWVVTTTGKQTDDSLAKTLEWYEKLDPEKRPVLRIWQIKQTNSLATEFECRLMSEAVHTIVLHARHRAEKGRLMLSLAGGRKTMSTDMQTAAAWFGCSAMIHVIDNPIKNKALQDLGYPSALKWGIEYFLFPFPRDFGDIFTPFIVGCFRSDPLSGIFIDDRPGMDPSGFLLEYPDSCRPLIIETDETCPLTEKIKQRKAKAGFLMCNYTSRMLQMETVTNFLVLYSLPEAQIKALKNQHFGTDPSREKEELALLKKLPKAELHCHLGGVADAQELVRIASAAKHDLAPYNSFLEPWLARWKKAAETGRPEKIMQTAKTLKHIRDITPEVPSALCTAAFILVFEHNLDLLDRVIYGDCCIDKNFCGIGFEKYEAMGDLQGSGLLQNRHCLAETCRILAEKAIDHHVKYLEIRCSPVNYTNNGLTGNEVYEIISRTFAAYNNVLKTSILFTASRHGNMEVVKNHVDLAAGILEGQSESSLVPLRGFDLAGDEKRRSAAEMQQLLMPMMEQCLHFTIHAGENQPVKSIWEAVYHLNSERIGHGLTLKDNINLKKRFRDRNIVLEMCPSSNFQIVGYKDNFIKEASDLNEYPLKNYLNDGLKVTVNTDNPGISRTDFTKELHRACRLTPGGLSAWEILSLIRNSFKASFAPWKIKNKLLKEAEADIIKICEEWISF